MAQQICPSCHVKAFTWYLDEEETPLTQWICDSCKFHALEDETDECVCDKCGVKTKSKLQTKEKGFWWCSSCNEIELF